MVTAGQSSNHWKRPLRRLPIIGTLALCTVIGVRSETVITVDPAALHQEFQGMGCGAIFYEAHITCLGAAGRTNEQEQLYDTMFRDVNMDLLQLFIRHDHEPQNDNNDPYDPAFDEKNFAYCQHTLAICAAAKKRRPNLKLHAVLYTPPEWMKTNNDASGGGTNKATLKAGLELEAGEFIWAFLDHMRRNGQPIDYVSFANECDWGHTQPGYFMTPDRCADVHAIIGAYLDEMARKFPATPRPKIVAPNTLSAVDCAGKYLPALLTKAAPWVDVVGCHDYDRRGDRWRKLVEKAGGRPVWQTESCFNGHDASPDLINSATEHWLNMTEAFNGGVNVWMAYDWVYPPRQGGEALIHVSWGRSFHPTKIYHAMRQWCAPLTPGMRVADTTVTGEFASGFAKPGVKASAFADDRHLVVQVANVQDRPAAVRLNVGANTHGPARRVRTTANEVMQNLPALVLETGATTDELPPRALTTYEVDR